MLILSRVCAEFRDHTGAVVHRVTPETRLTFREAPETIREDPLFQMLVEEGSLEAAVTHLQRKKLEADPLEGTDAAGRKGSAPGRGSRASNTGRKQEAPSGKPDGAEPGA